MARPRLGAGSWRGASRRRRACRPRAAATICSECHRCGVQSTTASTEGSASASRRSRSRRYGDGVTGSGVPVHAQHHLDRAARGRGRATILRPHHPRPTTAALITAAVNSPGGVPRAGEPREESRPDWRKPSSSGGPGALFPPSVSRNGSEDPQSSRCPAVPRRARGSRALNRTMNPCRRDHRGAPFVDPLHFRHVVGHLASGVTVLTTAADGPALRPDGQLGDLAVGRSADDGGLRQQRGALLRSGRRGGRVRGERPRGAPGRPRPPVLHRRPRTSSATSASTSGTAGCRCSPEALAHIECVVEEQVVGGSHSIFIGRVHLGHGRRRPAADLLPRWFRPVRVLPRRRRLPAGSSAGAGPGLGGRVTCCPSRSSRTPSTWTSRPRSTP